MLATFPERIKSVSSITYRLFKVREIFPRYIPSSKSKEHFYFRVSIVFRLFIFKTEREMNEKKDNSLFLKFNTQNGSIFGFLRRELRMNYNWSCSETQLQSMAWRMKDRLVGDSGYWSKYKIKRITSHRILSSFNEYKTGINSSILVEFIGTAVTN